jgi:hypothetical protein
MYNASLRARESTALAGVGVGELCWLGTSRCELLRPISAKSPGIYIEDGCITVPKTQNPTVCKRNGRVYYWLDLVQVSIIQTKLHRPRWSSSVYEATLSTLSQDLHVNK